MLSFKEQNVHSYARAFDTTSALNTQLQALHTVVTLGLRYPQ